MSTNPGSTELARVVAALAVRVVELERQVHELSAFADAPRRARRAEVEPVETVFLTREFW